MNDSRKHNYFGLNITMSSVRIIVWNFHINKSARWHRCHLQTKLWWILHLWYCYDTYIISWYWTNISIVCQHHYLSCMLTLITSVRHQSIWSIACWHNLSCYCGGRNILKFFKSTWIAYVYRRGMQMCNALYNLLYNILTFAGSWFVIPFESITTLPAV